MESNGKIRDIVKAAMRIGFILLLLLLQGFADHPRLLEQRLFAEINYVRSAQHLPDLRWNARIAEQARRHSERMMHHHFLSHEDPDYGGPGDRLSMAGIAWRACAENIYEEFGRSDPVRSAVQSWMQSPGHRQNLLSRTYTNSGIGMAVSSQGEVIVTQMFVAF